jgi:RHS repeat-associated protein
VHTDHLNTPRRVTRPSDNKLMWTWYADPFGSELPNENPASGGTFKYNLRFPGQLYDSHAGLNQNYFRDYDSAIGRYIESDPTGLDGGLNTYAGAPDPNTQIDPLGLVPRVPSVLYRPRPPQPDDCGSGLTQPITPNSFAGLVDLTGACRRHDQCYTCGGTGVDRAKCDAAFRKEMELACKNAYLSRRIYILTGCYERARQYFWLVRIFGSANFNYRSERAK